MTLQERADATLAISYETHQQGMACFGCGLAGFTPREHFPQEPGVWNRLCPRCNGVVWVTEVVEKDKARTA
jgi:hypothetical protein